MSGIAGVSVMPLSATETIGAVFSTVKDWTKWLGREVVTLASEGFGLVKEGLLSLVDLVKYCWEAAKPVLHKMLDFLKSNAGIVSIALLFTVMLGKLAVSLDDRVAQYSLMALSYVSLTFGIIYGCQTGVIPVMF